MSFKNFYTKLVAARLDLIALLARFSIAAVFWQSGQTKIQGLQIDLVNLSFNISWPSLAPNTIDLFAYEYNLPLIPPSLAAVTAACAEHIFPLMLLLGIGTKLGAAGLLGMTAVIQLLVYPDAYATHGTWAAILLYLIFYGPGRFSTDYALASKRDNSFV